VQKELARQLRRLHEIGGNGHLPRRIRQQYPYSAIQLARKRLPTTDFDFIPVGYD
jgi:hypothetical protein